VATQSAARGAVRGDVSHNPATRETSIVIEAPEENDEGRLVAELHLEPGAAVALEHMHPALHERFEVLEGQLGWKLDGEEGVARPGDALEIPARSWHDWWQVGDAKTVCRVTVTPGDRFIQLIETIWGLGVDGLTDDKGAPAPLQLVAISKEFADIFVPRHPPAAVQKVLFGVLGPIARARGYRASYRRYATLRFEGTPEDVRAGRPLTPVWSEGAGPPRR
jgi:mannose-6-phosphate isomerase-like protein (cupin superfamily)